MKLKLLLLAVLLPLAAAAKVSVTGQEHGQEQ